MIIKILMIRVPEQCSLAGMNIKDNSEITHGNDKNEDDNQNTNDQSTKVMNIKYNNDRHDNDNQDNNNKDNNNKDENDNQILMIIVPK